MDEYQTPKLEFVLNSDRDSISDDARRFSQDSRLGSFIAGRNPTSAGQGVRMGFIDRHYRLIMLLSMLIELGLLAYIAFKK